MAHLFSADAGPVRPWSLLQKRSSCVASCLSSHVSCLHVPSSLQRSLWSFDAGTGRWSIRVGSGGCCGGRCKKSGCGVVARCERVRGVRRRTCQQSSWARRWRFARYYYARTTDKSCEESRSRSRRMEEGEEGESEGATVACQRARRQDGSGSVHDRSGAHGSLIDRSSCLGLLSAMSTPTTTAPPNHLVRLPGRFANDGAAER